MAQTPEQKERGKLLGKYQYYESLLRQNRMIEAENFAKANAVGPYAVMNSPQEVILRPPPPEPEVPEETKTHWRGWLKECDAEVVKTCINKRVVQIKLPDKKLALLWNHRDAGPWKVGATVHVVLNDRKGEPIYVGRRKTGTLNFVQSSRSLLREEKAAEADVVAEIG